MCRHYCGSRNPEYYQYDMTSGCLPAAGRPDQIRHDERTLDSRGLSRDSEFGLQLKHIPISNKK